MGDTAIRYVRSPAGVVLDLNPLRGGDADAYLARGWTPISPAAFQRSLREYQGYQGEKRAEWLKKMADRNGDFSDYRKVAAKIEQFVAQAKQKNPGLVRYAPRGR